MGEAATAKDEEPADAGKQAAASGGSMEEILASIRNIIASEDSGASAEAEKSVRVVNQEIDSAPRTSVETRARSADPVTDGSSVSDGSRGTVATTSNADQQEAPGGSLAALVNRINSVSKRDTPSVADSTSPALQRRTEEASPKMATTMPAPEPPASATGLAALAERVKQPVGSGETAAIQVNDGNSTDANSENKNTVEAPMTRSLADIAAGEPQGSVATSVIEEPVSSQVPPSAEPVVHEAARKDEIDVVETTLSPAADGKSSPGQTESDRMLAGTVAEFREALVAPSTQAAVSGSMDRLKQVVAGVDAAQVETALRPMLKEWLDEHLPEMVEKMVQQEIDSIVNKS